MKKNKKLNINYKEFNKREITLIAIVSLVIFFSMVSVVDYIVGGLRFITVKGENLRIVKYVDNSVSVSDDNLKKINTFLSEVKKGIKLSNLTDITEDDMVEFAIKYIQNKYSDNTEYIKIYTEPSEGELNSQEEVPVEGEEIPEATVNIEYKYVTAEGISKVIEEYFGRMDIKYENINVRKYYSEIDGFELFDNISLPNYEFKLKKLEKSNTANTYIIHFDVIEKPFEEYKNKVSNYLTPEQFSVMDFGVYSRPEVKDYSKYLVASSGTIRVEEITSGNTTKYLIENLIMHKSNFAPKIDEDKPVLYIMTSYNDSEKNIFEIDAKIPILNIKSADANIINKSIKENFLDILNRIKGTPDKKGTIYKVNYEYHINGNILSIIVQSDTTEKDGVSWSNIQTYNYDLKQNKLVTLKEFLDTQKVSEKTLHENIIEKIKEINVEKEKLKQQGLSTYIRNPNDEMYTVEKTQSYYLDNKGILIIIYNYGINKIFPEFDKIEFKII